MVPGLLRRSVIRVATALRDGWLLAGATLLLLLVLEGAYRLQATVRHEWLAPTGETAPPSPFDRMPWAADYWIGHLKEEAVRWAPYVYRRNPTFDAPHASVDGAGHRVTPLPVPVSDARPAVRVFFLGGSTTFGWYQRAEHTIPAEAARRLQALLGDTARAEVTNFGVPGHTFTQEILELILQLRAGARPDVVMFYDGINDVMATVQNREAGLPQNEWNREEDFHRGRALAAESGAGFLNDLRTLRRIIALAIPRLHLARRIMGANQAAPPPIPPADALAYRLAATFAANARLVEALAAQYGFEAVYVWQPALLSTNKPLTAREAWLQRPHADPFVETVRALHRRAPAALTPAMAAAVGSRFVDATDVLDGDSGEVYVDLFGHTYERANPAILDRVMPALGGAVTRAARRSEAE